MSIRGCPSSKISSYWQPFECLNDLACSSMQFFPFSALLVSWQCVVHSPLHLSLSYEMIFVDHQKVRSTFPYVLCSPPISHASLLTFDSNPAKREKNLSTLDNNDNPMNTNVEIL
uniref:Ovule protein n=1 Tax=Ascaris lumbricoides TaxID=6252 RepID=A0A0M3HKF7_ASCLU